MSKSKSKGTSFERLCADYQKEEGFPVDRIVLHGSKDVGDLTILFDSVQECKDWGGKVSLGTWFGELDAEMRNANVLRGWVIHKRRGKGRPEDQYVTMTQATLMSLLKEIVD